MRGAAVAGTLAVLLVSASLTVVDAGMSGTATWYCGHGSRCPAGWDGSDLVAAIDRADTPYEKGDRLRVTHGDRHVDVLIVDVCACKGERIIDLTSGAFARLAPLWRGVIPVTIRRLPELRLPETDTATTGRWWHL